MIRLNDRAKCHFYVGTYMIGLNGTFGTDKAFRYMSLLVHIRLLGHDTFRGT